MMALDDQLTELNAAIAELADSSSAAMIEQAIAELTDAIKAKSTTPQVQVHVSPTPVTNVVNVPPSQAHGFRFDFKYNADGQIVSAVCTRITK